MGDRAPIHATAPPAGAHVLISHNYIFLFDIDIDPTLIFAKLNKIIATSDDYFFYFFSCNDINLVNTISVLHPGQ